jgi:RNA polymerase sigma-70 factor (ECF subfamily)
MVASHDGDSGLVAGQEQLTRLLQAWSQGDDQALTRLAPIVYGELRKLARFHVSREAPGHTLQATALLNEAFIRLIDIEQADWPSRKHFYAAASQIMRRVLVDYARKKHSFKRGRELQRVPFEEAATRPATETEVTDIVLLDQAMRRLADLDPRKAQVVEFWFFAGMTVQEIAKTMEISTATVERDLEFAKVWLAREFGSIGA